MPIHPNPPKRYHIEALFRDAAEETGHWRLVAWSDDLDWALLCCGKERRILDTKYKPPLLISYLEEPKV